MDVQEIESEPVDPSHENVQQSVLSDQEHDESIAIAEVIDIEACLTSLRALKNTTSSDLPIDLDQIEPFMLDSRNQQYNVHPTRFTSVPNRLLSNAQPVGSDLINLDYETNSEKAENTHLNYYCPICMRPLDRKEITKFCNPDDTDDEQDNISHNPIVKWSATKCGHIFCHKCIKASLRQKKSCPVCRRTLNTSRDIIPLYF